MTTDRPHRSARDSDWPMILLIVGAGVVSAFQVGKAPAALNAVQADLSLDLTTASWLLSAFAIVGAIAGAAIGLLIDRSNAKGVAVIGLLLQAAASAGGALANGAAPLLVMRAAEGVGFLAVIVAAPALIVALAPRELNRALAAWATFMPVGMALILLGGAPLLTTIGWRGLWLANGLLPGAYALAMAIVIPRLPAKTGQGHQSMGDDLRRTLSAGGPWIIASLFGIFAANYFAIFAFLPTILSDRLALSPTAGAMLTAVAVAASAVGNVIGGQLLARGARGSSLAIGAFAIMALSAFLIFDNRVPPLMAYAACLIFSTVSGLIPASLLNAAPRQAPAPHLVGATMGFLMQGNNAGLVAGPVAASWIAESFGWPAIALLTLMTTAIASPLAMMLRRSE